MNVPTAPNLENVGIFDSHGAMNQRARDLLSSIMAKREKLEQHHKVGGVVHGGLSGDIGDTALEKPTTKQAPSSILARKFQEALHEKRNRLRKHMRLDDDHQDATQTTETSTTTPLGSPTNAGHTAIKILVTQAPGLTFMDEEKSPLTTELRSSVSWDEGPSTRNVSSLRKTRSFDGDLLLCNPWSETTTSPSQPQLMDRTKEKLVKSVSAASKTNHVAGKHQPLASSECVAIMLRTKVERRPHLATRSKSFESNRSIKTPWINLSLSMDRGLAKSLVSPRGDRSQRLMTLGDIEIPLEVSSLSTQATKSPLMKKCTSRRTGSKISVVYFEDSDKVGCTLPTTEARAAYIDKLYQPSAKDQMRHVRTAPSEKRKERAELDHEIIKTHQEEKLKADSSTPVIAVGHNYNTKASSGEDLMKLSLKDSCDRREMLRRLQLDMNRPKPTKKLFEAVRKAASVDRSDDSSTEEYFPFSDDSSCDFTTSSETTCFNSLSSALQTNHRKTTKVRFAVQPPSVSRNDFLTKPTIEQSPFSSRDIFRHEGEVPACYKSCKPKQSETPLVVQPEVADQRCQAMGGLFDLATRSGLDKIGKVPLKRLPGAVCFRPQVHLSTDFRCGTFGSLYDIALRSGCSLDTTKPRLPPKTKLPGKTKLKPVTTIADPRQPPARGSLYDLALLSGLTKDMIRSRSSFSFTVKHSSKGIKPCVVLPEDSDKRCGACGSLYLASTCLEKRATRMPQIRPRDGLLYSVEEMEHDFND